MRHRDGRTSVGLVVEEELGHRVYGARLRERLGREKEWLRLVDLPVVPGLDGFWEKRAPFRSNETLRKSLRAARLLARHRGELDVVLLHTQTSGLFVRGVLGRRAAVVMSTDGTPKNIDELSTGYWHRQGSRVEEELKRRLTSRPLRDADAVVAWSRWTLRSLVEDYGVSPRRARALSPGVDTDWWSPRTSTPERASTPVRLLFVGGDFVRKGGRELLTALDGVSGGWSLDVVTESELPVSDPRVRVHHGLRGRDPALRDLYRAADVFVLPTRGDTFGLVLLEAMASGLPVVSTTVGAVPEIVRDGETGLVVPPGDAHRLRAALQRLLDDPDERARMGARGRRVTLSSHDAATNEDELVALLRRVARPPVGGRLPRA